MAYASAKVKVEMIDGFDIPKRPLNYEELYRPISLERFTEYHHTVGEDFVDTHSSMVGCFGFAAYIYSKRGMLKSDMLDALQDDDLHEQDFLSIYEDHGIDDDEFYTDYAQYINTNPVCKARVNQILIQVQESYSND